MYLRISVAQRDEGSEPTEYKSIKYNERCREYFVEICRSVQPTVFHFTWLGHIEKLSEVKAKERVKKRVIDARTGEEGESKTETAVGDNCRKAKSINCYSAFSLNSETMGDGIWKKRCFSYLFETV